MLRVYDTCTSTCQSLEWFQRLQPPSAEKKDRLPECYCIISKLQSWNFYNELLKQVQRKRFVSAEHAHELLQAAYGRPMPLPGQEAWIKTCGPTPPTATARKLQTVILRRPSDKRFEKVLLLTPSVEVLVTNGMTSYEDHLIPAFVMCLSMNNLIKIVCCRCLWRVCWSICRGKTSSCRRLLQVSVACLLEYLSRENLIKIFSSVLLERRIIFTATQLGWVSSWFSRLFDVFTVTWECLFCKVH